MANKPNYETSGTKATSNIMDMSFVDLGDGKMYFVPAAVARYVEALQADRERFEVFRRSTTEEMDKFVTERARDIITALNGTSFKYNMDNCYLWKKVDTAGDHKTMRFLTELICDVVFDTANKAPGSDPRAEGLTKE